MSRLFVCTLLVLAGCEARDATPAAQSITEQQQRRAVHVPTADKRVWADHAANAIWISEPDGSAPRMLYPNLPGPYGLSVDVATQQLVFTSSELEVVQIAPLGGGAVTTLRTSFEESYAIVVDEGTHKVLYGVRDNQLIKLTENTEFGTEQVEVLLQPVTGVHGLALTPDGSALYLGDAVGQMNRKLNIATHGVEALAYAGPSESSLEVLP
jgi:hypothetical protein